MNHLERGFVVPVWVEGTYWYEGWATADLRRFVWDDHDWRGREAGGEDWRLRPRDPNAGGADRPGLPESSL